MVALLSLVLILPMNTKTPMVDVKLLGKLVFSINQEPFDNISLEKMDDATWHYVGKQLIDLNAKSLPLQLVGLWQQEGGYRLGRLATLDSPFEERL